jgi:hypothetical protein
MLLNPIPPLVLDDHKSPTSFGQIRPQSANQSVMGVVRERTAEYFSTHPSFRPACGCWYLSRFPVKSPKIYVGTQYIVEINHPGHYMKISEMELPQHLYTKTTSPCGTNTKYTIAADKLVSWASEGRGKAINELCHTVYERKIASINAWERDRMLQLEDEWTTAGDGEDMYSRKFLNVKHYPTTCEDVAKDAEMKRANAKERLAEHQIALVNLVQEARGFISTHYADQEEGDMLPYLLILGAIGAFAYVLLT